MTLGRQLEHGLLVDLSVRASRLNTSRVYTGLGKIRIGCISDLGKIRAGVFRFYGFRINPTGLERLFPGLFLFLSKKIEHIYYLKLFVFNEEVFEF